MPYQYIRLDRDGRLAYLTLARPEKRNAFNAELVAELKQALAEVRDDAEAKVLIIRAEGKVFSAGADLAYLQQLQGFTTAENVADSQSLAEFYEQLYNFPKVTIAQVQGHAIAGGCGIATVCDFSFAVPEARFGYTEVRIGFVPAIVMVFLQRKIAGIHLRELLLTGSLIDAARAVEYGLINGVVPAENLSDYVRDYALKLCKTASSDALRLTKSMLNVVPEMGLQQALAFAAEQNALARTTDDCKRGIAGFLAKERVEW